MNARATQPGALSLLGLPGLCCSAVGSTWQRAEVLNSAWVLLYTALHLLDSVEDDDEPDAAWAQWGTGPTINFSTGLLARASITLYNLETSGVTGDAAQAIRQDFWSTLLRMTAGQHADLTLQTPTLQQCWEIAAAKSGAFFGLGCWAGARLEITDPARLAWFRQFGHSLGLLVQIGDDLDGLWARDDSVGDLRMWPRWTLPAAYAMSVLDACERASLHASLQAAPQDRDAEIAARDVIIASGAVLYLATETQRHVRRAHGALLAAAPPSNACDELLALLRTYTPLTHP